MLSFFLVPSNALLTLWTVSLCFFILKPNAKRPRRYLAFFSITLAFILWTPLSYILAKPLAQKFSQHKKDPNRPISHIIHLSGAERPNIARDKRSVLLNDQNGRYFEVARLAALYPDAKIIFSGGYTSETSSDIDIAKQLYTWFNLKERATFIGDAESTYGNAREVKFFLDAQGLSANNGAFLMVTSAMHMPRSVLCFNAMGIDVIPAPAEATTPATVTFSDWFTSPVDSENLRTFDLALHEWVGLLSYRIQGRINRFWPTDDGEATNEEAAG